MLAEQLRQDQIANDLANSSTAGYKAERTTQQSFGSMLLTNSLTGGAISARLCSCPTIRPRRCNSLAVVMPALALSAMAQAATPEQLLKLAP